MAEKHDASPTPSSSASSSAGSSSSSYASSSATAATAQAAAARRGLAAFVEQELIDLIEDDSRTWCEFFYEDQSARIILDEASGNLGLVCRAGDGMEGGGTLASDKTHLDEKTHTVVFKSGHEPAVVHGNASAEIVAASADGFWRQQAEAPAAVSGFERGG